MSIRLLLQNTKLWFSVLFVGVGWMGYVATHHVVLSTVLRTGEVISGEKVRVERVVDGDTIVLVDGRRVRYIGINTPEIAHTQTGTDECFGLEAKERNRALTEGKVVYLEKDISETDQYGRLLRYVYADGFMVNSRLVEEGFARVDTFPPDVRYRQLFSLEQSQSRAQRIGIWAEDPCL